MQQSNQELFSKTCPNPSQEAGLFWYYVQVMSGYALGLGLGGFFVVLAMLVWMTEPERAPQFFLAALIIGGVGWGIYGLPYLVYSDQVTLTREDQVITSSLFEDLSIGSQPAVRVQRKTEMVGENGQVLHGYRIDWLSDVPEDSREEADAFRERAEQSGVQLVGFCRDYRRARQFAEGLCKLGEADLIWMDEAGSVSRRSHEQLDTSLRERMSPKALSTCPYPDEMPVHFEEDASTAKLVWEPGINRRAVGFGLFAIGAAVVFGIVEYTSIPVEGDLHTVIYGFGGTGVLFLAGAYMFPKLQQKKISVSRDGVEVRYRRLGIFPVEQRISASRIEEVRIPPEKSAYANHFSRLVLVGDDLYEPIGTTMSHQQAKQMRKLIMHALVREHVREIFDRS